MLETASPARILVGLTTYAGNFETRLILRKVLRHFRWRNGARIDLMVVSDGPVLDPQVYEYASHVVSRPGPSGLQQGELDSLHLIADFARCRGYDYVLKTSGDIILNVPDWANRVVGLLRGRQKRILSTHWFSPASWVVGTKFFAADVDFLAQSLPASLDQEGLEETFTASIRRHFRIEEVACLIDSTTGEAHEVGNELRDWQWEHAHRLYKFRNLDDPSSLWEMIGHRRCLYPALRVRRQIMRSFGGR